jgi:hypothetical protein
MTDDATVAVLIISFISLAFIVMIIAVAASGGGKGGGSATN